MEKMELILEKEVKFWPGQKTWCVTFITKNYRPGMFDCAFDADVKKAEKKALERITKRVKEFREYDLPSEKSEVKITI